jgi:hypothetical protein
MNTPSIRRRVGALAAAGAVAATAAIAGPAVASRAGTPGIHYGRCTGHGTVALNLQNSDPGYLEAGFEIDGMRPGSLWTVALSHDGALYYRGTAAVLPDGSFSIDKVMRNLPGVDRFTGTARNRTTGEVCTVSAVL